VGAHVDAGTEVAVIESVKAASDIYSPVTGDVTEINPALEDEPEAVNSSPYGDGWLFRVMPTDVASMSDLMDAEAYAAAVEE
jgi:glycine cleavage system H protein